MILPLVKWLKDHGVDFQYGIDVKNVLFDINNGRKVAKTIEIERDGNKFNYKKSLSNFYKNWIL